MLTFLHVYGSWNVRGYQYVSGNKEDSIVAGDFEALLAELPVKYRRERL